MYFGPHTFLGSRDTVLKLRKQEFFMNLRSQTYMNMELKNKTTLETIGKLWNNEYQRVLKKIHTTIEIALM